jgi:hypothetical protein
MWPLIGPNAGARGPNRTGRNDRPHGSSRRYPAIWPGRIDTNPSRAEARTYRAARVTPDANRGGHGTKAQGSAVELVEHAEQLVGKCTEPSGSMMARRHRWNSNGGNYATNYRSKSQDPSPGPDERP